MHNLMRFLGVWLVAAPAAARPANASRCARRVVVRDSGGRLGNQLFSLYACYGIARRHDLCLRATPGVCAALDLGNATDVACPGEPQVLPGRAPQVLLKPPGNIHNGPWWAHHDARHAINAERRPRVDFQCLGYRQNAAAVAAAGVVFPWRASIAARARAVYENATNGLDADVVVALYHRVAAGERQYQKCLPAPGFYAAARREFERTIFLNRTVAYITSSYQFRDAAAIAAVLGEGVRALDDREPAVVMAALAMADAATFSWGSFSWWVARLTTGPVLYTQGLRNDSWLEATGCGALVFGKGKADARRTRSSIAFQSASIFPGPYSAPPEQ